MFLGGKTHADFSFQILMIYLNMFMEHFQIFNKINYEKLKKKKKKKIKSFCFFIQYLR